MFHMMLLSEESYVIDFSSMPLQLVFHALLVLVLFFILGKLLFKPVQKILDKRKEMVQSSIDDAQQKQQQAQELKAEYDQKLAAAMTERDQIIQDAYKTAQEKERAILEDARQEAARIRERASREVAQEQDKARDLLKRETVSLASAIAEKFVRESISDSDQKQLVEDAIAEMEDANWQN